MRKPNDWVETRPLGEVADLDRTTVSPEDIVDGTRYVGLENITSGGDIASKQVVRGDLRSSKFRFTEKHILYGKLRPYLSKIASPGFAGVCSTDIIPLLPGSGLSRRYLRYYLRSPEVVSFANARSSGVNLPRLSPKELAKIHIPLPPLPEQRRIADILDRADELRAKRRATIAHLDSLTQSIFIDMFGDPGKNLLGWPTVVLGDLVREGDKINYGVVQPGSETQGGRPMIRVKDLLLGSVDPTEVKRIAPEIEGKYERSRLFGDEVLVACVGSIGRVLIADERLKGWNIARAVSRVPLGSEVLPIYVSAYLNTQFVQDYFRSETRAVAQPTLNVGDLKRTPVRMPPLADQRSFAKRISAVVSLQVRARDALTRSGDLFASLQYRAFRGEL